MTRIALGVEYDGSNYQGFQKQFEVNSIQQCLEEAVGRIANHKVDIFCAGRTDAGVNATQQVIHFDYLGDKPRDVSSWMRGCNVFLPPDISIKWAKEVPDYFHARFSAFERTYRYIILNSHSRPAILNGGISFYPGRRLDENLMHEAGQYLLGENDFSSFRASECQSKTPFRNVHSLSVTRDRDYIIVEISANAFLHHMVRNIVGDLLEVGYHRRPKEWIRELLEARDRTLGGENAQPYGLYLVGVAYDPKYGIPSGTTGPLWFR